MKLYGRVNGVETEIGTGGGGGADNVVEGYRNDTDGLFYEEDTYTTAITGAENTVYIDLPNDKTYRWNGTTFVRLDDVEPIQYTTMPTASEDYYGKIVQYVGTTTAQYTQGYFYKCDYGSTPRSYRWVKTDVVGISTKQNKIIQTPSVTLTVAGWTNNQQTVGTGGVAILEDNRNIIDIPYEEVQTWADCGVMLFSHSAYGTDDEMYINELIFQCDTVPDTALTFRVTSMEVS